MSACSGVCRNGMLVGDLRRAQHSLCLSYSCSFAQSSTMFVTTRFGPIRCSILSCSLIHSERKIPVTSLYCRQCFQSWTSRQGCVHTPAAPACLPCSCLLSCLHLSDTGGGASGPSGARREWCNFFRSWVETPARAVPGLHLLHWQHLTFVM